MNEIIFRYLNGFAGKWPWFDAVIIFCRQVAAMGFGRAGLIVFIFIHRHKGDADIAGTFFLGEIEDKGVGHDSFFRFLRAYFSRGGEIFLRESPDLLKFLQM